MNDDYIVALYNEMRQDVYKLIESKRREAEERRNKENREAELYLRRLLEPPMGLRRRTARACL